MIGKLRDRQRRDAVRRIERRVLIHAIAQRILQFVVHSEAGAHHRLARDADSMRIPMRGCGRNFALLAVNALLAMRGWLEITPFGKV